MENTMSPPQPENGRKVDLIWLASCSAVTALAAMLRFIWLGLKPFHHDEGVNGWFLTTLYREGIYKYDPANYHGPTLYYIALGFANVFDLDTETVRASVAIFGVLTVVLAFFLRNYIGRIGALCAGLFLALSPGMVYISRYFIHEMSFVFLSLGLVVSIVYFTDRRKAGLFAIAWAVLLLFVCFLPSTLNLAHVLANGNDGVLWALRFGFLIVEAVLIFFVVRMLLSWQDGRPIYFLLASACAVLMFATKETAFITIGTIVIASFCVWLWQRLYKRRHSDENSNDIFDSGLNWQSFASAMGSGGDRLLLFAAAAVVFVYLGVLFFSSFFSYREGVAGAIEAYAIWTRTGSRDHTQNGMWAYLEWGWETEAPILILFAIGILLAFVKARHRFAMFVGLWAFGLFAAYTIIPYKTPWLAINFLLPMCIIAGYGINVLATTANLGAKIAAAVLAIVSAVVLANQMYDHNFVRFADEDTVYAYAHTRPEFLDMVERIEHYAEKSGKGRDASIQIVSPDYWPLVWYLREYPQAIFHGQLIDTDTAEVIIAKKGDQDTEVIRRYSANYYYVDTYGLRSGVDLILLVRKDLAGDEGKQLYRLTDLR